jgi:hypothetical protein
MYGSAFATAILSYEFIDKSNTGSAIGNFAVAKRYDRLKVYKECAERVASLEVGDGERGGRRGKGEKPRLMSLGRW